MEQLTSGNFGRYQILRPLGEGGMAQVYLCVRHGAGGFEKRVVLKVLHSKYLGDPEFVRMFLDEARLLARLRHPNIVDVFEVECVDGVPYLAMEYVNGPTLSRLHRQVARTELDRLGLLLHVVQKVCDGLHFAHTLVINGQPAGLVHRDVSTQNIVIDAGTGMTKLIDFGIAKAQDRGGQEHKTQVGVLKGKIHYMAPEVLRGKPADARADLFSVGVVMYRMVTGQLPFVEGADLWAARIEGTFRPPSELVPGLPDGVERVVSKALQPDPDKRYQTAAELGADLNDLVNDLRIDPQQLSPWIHQVFPGGEEEWQRKTEGGSNTMTRSMHSSLSRLLDESRSSPAVAAPPASRGPTWPLVVGIASAVLLVGSIGIGAMWPQPDSTVVVAAPLEVQTFLDGADQLLAGGDFDGAQAMNRRASALHPTDASQLVRLTRQRSAIERGQAVAQAKVEIQRGMTEAARRTLQAALRDAPSDQELMDLLATLDARSAPDVPVAPVLEVVEAPPRVVAAPTPPSAAKAAPRPPGTKTAPPALAGTLVLNATPSGVAWLDGAVLGETPIEVTGLAAGEHLIEVRARGYVSARQSLRMKAGERQSVQLALVAEPVAVSAVAPAPATPPAPAPAAAVEVAAAAVRPAPAAPAGPSKPSVELPSRATVTNRYELHELLGPVQEALDASGADTALTHAALSDFESVATPRFEAGQTQTVDPQKVYTVLLGLARSTADRKELLGAFRKAARAGAFE